MKYLKIGIDLSINSTGICVIDEQKNTTKFYQLVPQWKKKAPKHSKSVTLLPYTRFYSDVSNTNSKNDLEKILSAVNQSEVILKVIHENFSESECDLVDVRIEGASFGSNAGRLYDLSIYYAEVKRNLLNWLPIGSKISVIPPKTVKMVALGKGKGNAKKEEVVDFFLENHKEFNFDNTGKIDDVVDAFLLGNCDFKDDHLIITENI